jgi:hypothetical protein
MTCSFIPWIYQPDSLQGITIKSRTQKAALLHFQPFGIVQQRSLQAAKLLEEQIGKADNVTEKDSKMII